MIRDITVRNNEVYAVLFGEVSVQSATVIREALLQQVNKGHKIFHFDLAGVSFIDSAGLGVLVGIQNRVRDINGKVVVTGLRGEIKELFELTRLDKIFEIR